jgi:hypothetical protein
MANCDAGKQKKSPWEWMQDISTPRGFFKPTLIHSFLFSVFSLQFIQSLRNELKQKTENRKLKTEN